MYDPFNNGPELPDPSQLTLFVNGAQETVLNCSSEIVESDHSSEVMIRSPTEMSETQQQFISSLHRKSRELFQKNQITRQLETETE